MTSQEYSEIAFDVNAPADLRHDKKLSAEEKLLYLEIRAMCKSKGHCFPSNSFLAELFDVNERSIQRWLKSLLDNRYLNVVFQVKENNSDFRVIYIPQSKFPDLSGVTQMSWGGDTDVIGGRHECRNNTIIFNTDIINTNSENELFAESERKVVIEKTFIPFEEFWNAYGKKVGDKTKCKNYWNKLKQDDREKIIKTLPAFKKSVKDLQFLPYPTNVGMIFCQIANFVSIKKQMTLNSKLKMENLTNDKS